MSFWQDVRFGARTLRKSPGFTLTAVITLALGIGVTTATYSVTDAMLWKPVPIPRLDRLAVVLQRVPEDPNFWNSVSPADFEDIRQNSGAFDSLAGWQSGMANIVGADGQPDRVSQILVTANFFDVLGIHPALGRGFLPGEDQPGHGRVAVLSNALWNRRFGADPAILGKTIRLDDADYLVVGVMPRKVQFPLNSELWTPAALTPAERHSREGSGMIGIGILKSGRTPADADSELASLANTLARQYPATNTNRRFACWSAHDFLIGTYTKQYSLMMFASVLFVLLIACTNVANLQFARALGRTREVAVRTAIGAGRRRIVVQFVTESVLLSFAGAALGLLVAGWSLVAIKAGMPAEVEKYVLGWKDIALDGRALAFTTLAALAAGILSGLAPAWRSARPNFARYLKEGGRAGTAGREHHRLRNILVAAEIALSVVLLVGAGLMVRGVSTMAAGDRAYEPETLLTFQMAVTESKYKEPSRAAAFYRDLVEKVRVIPGVKSASAVTAVPHSFHSTWRAFDIEGKPPREGNRPGAQVQSVTPGFFRTMRVSVLAGRALAPSDGAETLPVAVISETMLRRFWPGEPAPLGKRIRLQTLNSPPRWFTIVGVSADAAQSSFDRGPRPILYVSLEQLPAFSTDFVVRTAGDPMRIAPAAIAAVRSLDPAQPVSQVLTLEVLRRHEATGVLYVAAMLAVFGLLALVLSAVGVYGVMSYLVGQQTHEIGIRMALGAGKGSVLSMVFRRGLLTAGVGLAVGMAGAYLISSRLSVLIWGVPASDPPTFTAIPLLLLAASAVAIYVPARRAIGIDPIVALRYE